MRSFICRRDKKVEIQRKGGKRMKIIKEEATKLWNNGLLDTEIAEQMNCSKVAVCIWRRKNDLPSNRGIFDWGGGKVNKKAKRV